MAAPIRHPKRFKHKFKSVYQIDSKYSISSESATAALSNSRLRKDIDLAIDNSSTVIYASTNRSLSMVFDYMLLLANKLAAHLLKACK